MVRPGHPLTQRRPIMFADLTGFPVACTGMSVAMGRLLVQRLGLQAHPDTLIALGSESVADLLDVACRTDAIYLGIMAPAAHLLAQGLLVALDIPTQGLESHIAWVQRVARTPNPVLDGIRQERARRAEQPAGGGQPSRGDLNTGCSPGSTRCASGAARAMPRSLLVSSTKPSRVVGETVAELRNPGLLPHCESR
eukprot:gene36679-59826_t